MKTKVMSGTLQEDLNALGVKGLDEDTMARIALGEGPMSEACKGKKGKQGDVCADCGEEPCTCDSGEEEDGEEDYQESVHDPIEGPFVTPVLFDRIMALPFDRLTEDQLAELIAELRVKKIPRNIPGIQERAEQVAAHLTEVRATVKRERVARKGSKKRRLECPPGYRKGKNNQCVRAVVAVGGAGALAKQQRKKARYARSGKGQMSATKSQRRAKLYGGESFAVELEHLLSETHEREMRVRDEIMERLGSVLTLIAEEFDDEAVAQVFTEATTGLMASYEAGRLDEDVMGADAFLAELRPVMALISKSLDKLERTDLGNG